jgi:hypothetical protein
MSNHAHRRPRPHRVDGSLVDVGNVVLGCTCNPDLRHVDECNVTVLHDTGCPAEDHGSQLIIRLPRQRN